jgi:SAM-dependent methyltransferase
VNDSAHADAIIALYQRHALAWAADRGTSCVETPWLDRLRALIPPNPHILDIGCGAADPIARYLIENGATVTGIDSAPQMIALCAQKFPAQTWHIADMRTLSLNRTFDALIAWDSFFHLTPAHQREMFRIFRAHAASGAALMFTSGTQHGIALGSYAGEILYHASLDTEEYRALLTAHGFTVIAYQTEDPNCGRRTIWLTQRSA